MDILAALFFLGLAIYFNYAVARWERKRAAAEPPAPPRKRITRWNKSR